MIRRGEIWVARLHPNQVAEVGKVRPVVVIQADPLTEALRVHVAARDRLLRDSYAMAEQPRALDRTRIGEGPLTTLSAEEMAALEQALRGVMGMG